MAATKRNYYESGTSGGSVGENNRPSYCVNFLTTEAYSAEYVVVYARRLGTFTSVTAYLHAVDVSNKPTGGALATSQTIAGSSISTDVGEVTFTFDTPYAVTADTQYAIVITVVGGSDWNWFDWWIDTGGYRRGVYITGDDWYMYSPGSHWYQIWGSPVFTLTSPEDEATNVYLNEDWLQEMTYADGSFTQYSDYTVHFNGVAQNDRSRYSILSLKMWLGITLEYETTYEWFVRKDLGGEAYIDTDTWSFTTLVYAPPAYTTREKLLYGEDPGGATETVPTGENNQIVVRRVVAAAKNKIFYEDV